MLVVDASITLEWMLPGQRTSVADRAYERAKRGPIVVPAIWLPETQNVILKKLRQGRIDTDEAFDMRIELSLLSKRVDASTDSDVVDRIWKTAVDHMLTTYDASYVELAVRLGLPIASNDAAIRAAGKKLRLEVV